MLAGKVLELRIKLGLTQDQLAERVDRSPRHVQRIEAGEANLDLDGLDDLAAALGVELAELLTAPATKLTRRAGRPRR